MKIFVREANTSYSLTMFLCLTIFMMEICRVTSTSVRGVAAVVETAAAAATFSERVQF